MIQLDHYKLYILISTTMKTYYTITVGEGLDGLTYKKTFENRIDRNAYALSIKDKASTRFYSLDEVKV